LTLLLFTGFGFIFQ